MAKGRRAIPPGAELSAYEDFLALDLGRGTPSPTTFAQSAARSGIGVGQLKKWWTQFRRHDMPTMRGRQAMIDWLQRECTSLSLERPKPSSDWVHEAASQLLAAKSAGLPETERAALRHRVDTAVRCIKTAALRHEVSAHWRMPA